jgi:hypothetical protein
LILLHESNCCRVEDVNRPGQSLVRAYGSTFRVLSAGLVCAPLFGSNSPRWTPRELYLASRGRRGRAAHALTLP